MRVTAAPATPQHGGRRQGPDDDPDSTLLCSPRQGADPRRRTNSSRGLVSRRATVVAGAARRAMVLSVGEIRPIRTWFDRSDPTDLPDDQAPFKTLPRTCASGSSEGMQPPGPLGGWVQNGNNLLRGGPMGMDDK